jgi:hypothetical protein
MTAEDQRIIGRLEGGMANLEAGLARLEKNTRDDFGKVFARLEEIQSDGCGLGRRNARDIGELRARPERAVGILAAIAAVLGAVASWWRG